MPSVACERAMEDRRRVRWRGRATVAVIRLAVGLAVSGMLDLPPATARSPIGRYWRMERQLRADEERLHSAVGVSGSIWALRREMWQPLPPASTTRIGV